jgi:hypothetical protein
LELVELFRQMDLTQYLQPLHQRAVARVALVVLVAKHQVVLVEESVETTQQEAAELLAQPRKVLQEVELLLETTEVEVEVELVPWVKTELATTLPTTEVAEAQV